MNWKREKIRIVFNYIIGRNQSIERADKRIRFCSSFNREIDSYPVIVNSNRWWKSMYLQYFIQNRSTFIHAVWHSTIKIDGSWFIRVLIASHSHDFFYFSLIQFISQSLFSFRSFKVKFACGGRISPTMTTMQEIWTGFTHRTSIKYL